jgi:serine/threonine protein kinase
MARSSLGGSPPGSPTLIAAGSGPVSDPFGGAAAGGRSVGDTVGPYRLLRQLGEGTAGTVYEVEHLQIGRHAAMKILHPDPTIPGMVDRFFTEARAVNLIGNPHIVQITDLLQPADGHPVHALVMELLDGSPLADLLARQEPLPLARLLPIMAQVCEALAAVHAAGFVHRDLKPENVYLVRGPAGEEFVKLLDFGLVKVTRPDVGSPRSTVEGTFLGSPAYASPEQAMGKEVDARTDIYAVGVMLYELVTGRLPFDGESIGDMLARQVNQAPPHLPESFLATDAGLALDAIIQTCLAKDPAVRGLSAEELASMFRELAAGVEHPVPKLTKTHRTHRTVWRPRGRASRWAGAIASVVAVLLVALAFGRHHTGVTAARPRSAAALATVAGVANASTLAETVTATAPAPTEPPPAAATTKAEPRRAVRPKTWARTDVRIDPAMTLNPYR